MFPFNLTSTAKAASLVSFGLATPPGQSGCPSANWIGFSLYESSGGTLNTILGGIGYANAASFPSTKQAIMLVVDRPTSSLTPTFCTDVFVNGSNPAILYNGGAAPIDLNAMHLFTMQMELDKGNNTNTWIRWQVDNNAWITMLNSACSCLVSSGDVLPLYPFINDLSLTTTVQSIATLTDWVWATDYVPGSLPSGQLFRSPGTPPIHIPQPGVTGSLTDFLQFEANNIAPGNLYAGGMLLTIIISGVTFGVLFGVSRRFNISVRHYGLFFTMFVLGLAFLGFYASILPIWVPVMMAVITFGIAFGVIKTGNASGGLVPD
jgi:hypothetical protein